MATTTTNLERVPLFDGQPGSWPPFILRLNAALAKRRLTRISDGRDPRPPDISGDAATRAARAREQREWDDKNEETHAVIVERL